MSRQKIVDPLAARKERTRKTLDGDTVKFIPTVDSFIRERNRKKKRKVVVRFMRGL